MIHSLAKRPFIAGPKNLFLGKRLNSSKKSIHEDWKDFHKLMDSKIQVYVRMSIMDTVLETRPTIYKREQIIDYYNDFFENHYLKDTSVKPIIDTLIDEGVDKNSIKEIFSDHMAMRSPTLESGVGLLKDLIQSGLWEFKLTIKSNVNNGIKNSFQFTNIGNKQQLALTLCRTNTGDEIFNRGENMIPKYIFLSALIGSNEDQLKCLYQGPMNPFKDHPILHQNCSYLSPLIRLSQEYGAGAPNHFTININELCNKTRFKNIDEVHAFLKSKGFRENQSLSVIKDKDVKQYGYLGNNVYVELLERFAGLHGSFPDGFSLNSENISRIGSSIGNEFEFNNKNILNHG